MDRDAQRKASEVERGMKEKGLRGGEEGGRRKERLEGARQEMGEAGVRPGRKQSLLPDSAGFPLLASL